jgi:hypothetical protein
MVLFHLGASLANMQSVPSDRPSICVAALNLHADAAHVGMGRGSSTGVPRANSKMTGPKDNQLLTKLDYLEVGHSGRVCWLAGQPVV